MNLDDYPRAKRFLEEHPEMTIDQALEYLNDEARRRGIL